MRVAVIGGTGFVGRHVVDELHARGHQATAVARHAPREGGWHQGFRQANATHAHALDGALEGMDAVVFAAGSLRQERSQTFHDIHVSAVRHLVASCRAARVRRVVLVSSLSARPSSRSAYHRAKFAGEDLLRRSLLDVTVLRPSAIYGPGDDFLGPLARFLRHLPVAPLPGRGDARLAPVAAADVARAVAEALARPDTVGSAYDLPGPETLSIETIYERVMRAIGLHRPRLHVPYLVIEPLTYLLGNPPLLPFTFDHLALLEEERDGDPAAACAAFGLTLAPFTAEAIRAAVDHPR